jgi:hypothetical protein
MATYRQFEVADVQSLGSGYSFTVVSQAKRPLFAVVYKTGSSLFGVGSNDFNLAA